MSLIIAHSFRPIQSLVNKGDKSGSKEVWKAFYVDLNLHLLC